MAEPSPITFCLMVPAGTWDMQPLVDAIREHHVDANVVAVWCGDPHRRPVLVSEVSWADIDLPESSGAGWGVLLAGLTPRVYEWRRTAVSVGRMLGLMDSPVVVLRVGSTAVLGACGAVVANTATATLLRRSPDELPDDGLGPTESDVVRYGRHSTSVAAFGPGGATALRWLSARLVPETDEVGPLLDRMAELSNAGDASDEAIVVGWAQGGEGSVSLLDLDSLDRNEPWRLSFGERRPRVRLSQRSMLAAVVAAGIKQTIGHTEAILLPGAIAVDGAVRAAVRSGLRRWSDDEVPSPPPDPFGANNSEFIRWLEQAEPWESDIGRYWLALREQRHDLQTVYAQPQSYDASGFREWSDNAWRLERNVTVLLRGSDANRQPIVDGDRTATGFNVLGYLEADQSQGHIAREIVVALCAASVEVRPLVHHRIRAQKSTARIDAPREALYATNLVVVNPDQFDFVVADHGATLLDGRRTIAYWFWELEDVPEQFLDAIAHVDEIWTGSQFIAHAFARVTDKPVRCVPLPVAEPAPSNRRRDTMGLPDDAYVFLTTFDQFSVPERKNPFGTIEAFTRAFTDGEGPVLLIKTMNGSKSWRNHERLLLAVAGRSDIVVWDEHLTRADQMAVLAAADCLVSLHRSEGLGLHCAEAMWLGKPVIATAYSGNLDFMDDSVAAMIDYELTSVRHGEGIYPETAQWADPDLDQAADWMRRLVAEPTIGVELGRRAKARMQQQPTLAATGRLMAQLAGLPGSGEPDPRTGEH